MKPRVLAVVLNWNCSERASRAIRSLCEATSQDLEILVVDNGSDEDPTDLFCSIDSRVTVKRNPTNLGVAGGRNIGFAHALGGEFTHVLLLDDDAIAMPGMLDEMLRTSRDTGAAAVGPIIAYTDDPDTLFRAGGTSWRVYYLSAIPEIVERTARMLGIYPVRRLDASRGKDWPSKWSPTRDEEVDFVIGCCQLFPIETIRRVGMLDESFNPYGGEDIDYCERIHRTGERIHISANAMALHDRASSVSDPLFRTRINQAHIILLASKHLHPLTFAALYMPDLMMLQLPLKGVLYTARGDRRRLQGLLQGLQEGLMLGTKTWFSRVTELHIPRT